MLSNIRMLFYVMNSYLTYEYIIETTPLKVLSFLIVLNRCHREYHLSIFFIFVSCNTNIAKFFQIHSVEPFILCSYMKI